MAPVLARNAAAERYSARGLRVVGSRPVHSPEGFKLALAEFNATTPSDLQPATPPPVVLPVGPPLQTIPLPIGIDDPTIPAFFHTLSTTGIPLDDRSIQRMADKLAAALTARGGGAVVLQGDIHINAGDRDAEQLTDEMLAVLRTRSASGFSPIAGVLLPQ